MTMIVKSILKHRTLSARCVVAVDNAKRWMKDERRPFFSTTFIYENRKAHG